MTKPDLDAAAKAFARFCSTVGALRDPKTGCPWDLEQTHATLRKYMLEEAYEAVHAMGENDPKELSGELGDVLLQVVLNAQLALDAKKFSIVDVIDGIDAKMIRRHPHVFAKETRQEGSWDAIKAEEKKAAGTAKPEKIFDAADKMHPASAQAVKIGKIASSINFDWDDANEVFAQVRSEVEEVAEELAKTERDPARLADEIGDLYFSLAQLSRHLGLEPEVVALDANKKFLRRFAKLEEIAKAKGQDPRTASREGLEALWKAVKADEKAKARNP